MSTDIKLDGNGQITSATDGDAPLVNDFDALLQDIKNEALTEEGELFYDAEYGWSLKEFIQSEDIESCELEISERIKEKMAKRLEIDIASLVTTMKFELDKLTIHIEFKLMDSNKKNELDIELNRMSVEVLPYD